LLAAVGGDSVEPRAEGGALLEFVEAAPGRHERLLEHVFGVLQRAEDPVAVQLELAAEGVGELPERQLIARTGAVQQPLGHQLRPHRSTDTDLEENESAGSCTPAAVSQPVAHEK
jgi:hypothetical protein